ncbi:MAG: V-type ATP synthase subunit I [Clostridium sp.]
MAIVKMKKFTLLAFQSQKKELLQNLQRLQAVQFTEFNIEDEQYKEYLKQDSAYVEISEVEDKQAQVKFAIDFLSKYEEKKGMLDELKQGKESLTYEDLEKRVAKISWKSEYVALKELESKMTHKTQHISKLKSDIEELNKWINLDMPMNEIRGFKNTIAYLGTIPKNFLENLREEISNGFDTSYVETIGEDSREANILIIFHKDDLKDIDIILKRYSFAKVQYDYELVPREVIKEFDHKIQEIKIELNEISEEIKKHSAHLNEFKLVFEYFESELARLKSYEKFLASENIFVVEGYVPCEETNDFEKMLKNTLDDNYYLEVEDAQGDETPIMLKNGKLTEAFEPITEMYSLPKYSEIDPTVLLMPFYILFFGMMLSDAGYGMILFLGTLFGLKMFNLEDEMRKSFKMFNLLGLSTIFWGVMYGSYFGDALPLPALWMKPDSDVMLLMIVSVALGLVQIFVGLAIKAYMYIRDGKFLDALWDVGLWYGIIGGLILWGLSGSGVINNPTLATVCKYLSLVCAILIILTNGRGEESMGAKLGQGFYALYGITGYVGDLVSYTRLAALGLATGFISMAFNMMIGMFGNPIAKIIAGGLIFVVGHLFNLFINALGAYVHTCRLQYLEYFGKFYEGGGTAFKPLKYSSKYVKIVKK